MTAAGIRKVSITMANRSARPITAPLSSHMPIRTRRWDDPKEEGDGLRILITRYRPRGLPKADETWDIWMPNLGPSKELHAAVYGKVGTGISWQTYLTKYLVEMRA